MIKDQTTTLLLKQAYDALRDLDEIYCSARDEMTRAERNYARGVLSTARVVQNTLREVIKKELDND